MKNILILFIISNVMCNTNVEILSYNAQFKNLGAGSAIFKTITFNDSPEKEIHFSFKTKKFVDLFYKIRENIIMKINEENFIINHIKIDSQNRKRFKNHEARFDYPNNKAYFDNDSLFINKGVYNPISIIAFLRNQNLSIGNQFIFDTYNSGKIKTIGMEVINEETIKIKRKSYDCYVLTPFYLQASDENNKKGEIKLWIAKESYLPVIIEQNANFGEIILQLNNIEYAK